MEMKKQMFAGGLGEQTGGCHGEGKGVGWTRNLALIGVNYYLWNG